MMTPMPNFLRQLFAKARFMVIVLALAVTFNAATPKPANAAAAMVCTVLCNVAMMYLGGANCTAQCAAAIASAVQSIQDTVMSSLVTRVQILMGQKIATAQMQSQQLLGIRVPQARHIIENTPSADRGRCALGSVALLGSGSMPVGPGQVSPRPRTRVQPDGRRLRVDIPDERGVPATALERSVSDQISRGLLKFRTESKGTTQDAVAGFEAQQLYRPCPEGQEGQRCREAQQEAGATPWADISAESLFGQDTFDGGSEAAREAAADAAIAYCANLMVPGTPARVGAATNADAMIADAVQRAGDARVSLAIKACADATARRMPIPFNTDNPAFNWVVSAACAYRTAFRDQLFVGGENSDLSDTVNQACSDSDSEGNSDIHLSRLELMRIMSRDIFATGRFTVANAAADATDLQRMMIAMESINAQVNYEMLRMQEQLNLVQAARLAASLRTR